MANPTDDDKLAHAREQAQSQYESIVEMVAALECDYDRLEELRDGFESLTAEALAQLAADENAERNEEAREYLTLKAEAGECENEEDAQTRISEDPLSVEIRSGWYSPGDKPEPEEFCILLCTGGPACRIRGELGQHNEPRRAWIEFQDWFTPWTEFVGTDQDTLLTYARQFFYGE